MKLIAVGLVWTFVLISVVNYVTLYPGIPAVLTVAGAFAIGAWYSLARRRQQLTSGNVATANVDDRARGATEWNAVHRGAPGASAPASHGARSD